MTEALNPELADMARIAVARAVETAGIPFLIAHPEPHNLYSQRLVLAALWRGKCAEDWLGSLHARHIYGALHQWLLPSLVALNEARSQGACIDDPALNLERLAVTEFAWTAHLIDELDLLTAMPPVTRAQLREAVEGIKRDWLRREFVKMLEETNRAVRFGGMSVDDAVDRIGEWVAG